MTLFSLYYGSLLNSFLRNEGSSLGGPLRKSPEIRDITHPLSPQGRALLPAPCIFHKHPIKRIYFLIPIKKIFYWPLEWWLLSIPFTVRRNLRALDRRQSQRVQKSVLRSGPSTVLSDGVQEGEQRKGLLVFMKTFQCSPEGKRLEVLKKKKKKQER